jgi:hypothetical protein
MSNTVLVFIFFNMSMILLVYKKIYSNTNNLNSFISGIAISLIQDFKDNTAQLNLNLTLYYNFYPIGPYSITCLNVIVW